jgi:uncharacterized phage protein (TIGR02218 family)
LTTYPEAFAEHLAGEATTVCQCWKLTRKDGVVSAFTDHDLPLTVDGVACKPGLGFVASEARSSLGLGVDTVDVEGALSSADLSEDDIEAGLFDGATVETYLVNWAEPAQFARIRKAVIGKITMSDGRFVAELQSMAQSLDQPNGRTVRRVCDAELGDARCRFDLGQAGFTASGAVASVETADTIIVTGLGGFAPGWFANGIITWTSGGAAGRTARIVDHVVRSGEVALVLWDAGTSGPGPMPGDAFTVVAGCDKRFETCKAKFANQLNFRGFPHLPGNDAAYGYVTDGGSFDGGPLVP